MKSKFAVMTLVLIAALLMVPATTRADAEAEAPAPIPAAVKAKLHIPEAITPKLVVIIADENRNYSEEETKANAPDILSIEACHIGGNRILFRTTFAAKPDLTATNYIIYVDLDDNTETGRTDKYHKGTDVMLVTTKDNFEISYRNRATYGPKALKSVAVLHGTHLYTTVETPLTVKEGNITMGAHLLCQKKVPEDVEKKPRSDGAKHVSFTMPEQAGVEVPALPKTKKPELHVIEK
jgi:hypothetical protein